MCGLCGIAFSFRPSDLTDRVSRMTKALSHRGPDEGGFFYSSQIALGHRRLRIRDLSPTGSQPMSAGVRDVTVAFNGEVYNFRELRLDLQSRGYEFRGSSDTEVVLAAYLEWGTLGLEYLEGMFAIAIWDGEESRLILMRDRLGIKPLYYSRYPEGVVFASEPRALLESGLVSRSIDRQALSEFLWFGNPHGDRSIYAGVKALEPGCRAVWQDGKLRIERWWRVEDWFDGVDCSDLHRDPVGLVGSAIKKSVERQLVADVPVGLFLSGGLDSSAIAAAAAQAGQANELTAFTASFGAFGTVDERPKARRVAESLGIQLCTLEIGEVDVPHGVTTMVDMHGEPFADAANVALFALSARVSRHAKVVLQGDGGDELFGGYRRYVLLNSLFAWRLLPSWMFSMPIARNSQWIQRLGRLAGSLKLNDPGLRMALLLSTDTLGHSTFSYLEEHAAKRLLAETDPFLAYRESARRFAYMDPVRAMTLTDLTVQLPAQFLSKVDRATMASGVEARVPLLDELVARIAVNLPTRLKVRGTRRKVVLRDVVRKSLPSEIVESPKAGFSVPYSAWLLGPLHTMAQDALLRREFLESFEVRRESIRAGFESLRGGNLAEGYKLWKLFQLALWAKGQRYAYA